MATATAASAQASRPLQHVQPTPKTSTASQPAPAPTAAASKAPTPAGTLPRGPDVNRQSRIEEEIASALPPPSRLFYGPSEEVRLPFRSSFACRFNSPLTFLFSDVRSPEAFDILLRSSEAPLRDGGALPECPPHLVCPVRAPANPRQAR